MIPSPWVIIQQVSSDIGFEAGTMPALTKDKICPFFKHNLCLLGDDCRFSHKLPDADDGGDDSDSSDEEIPVVESDNVKKRPPDKFPEVARPPPTPSPSAEEIAELKKEIERAIQMTVQEMTMVPQMPKQPTATAATPHEAGDNSGGETSRVPKVAQPNPDTSKFRPRWTSVRDEFERCGVLPPPPPEPFLGGLNVDNGDTMSAKWAISNPIPINNSVKTARALDNSLGASPILRVNHNAPGPTSVAPVNGHRLALVHPQYPPPVASFKETSALGAIPKSARIPPPSPSTLASRKFQPLRRPAPSINISHYCHTCKQDVGTVNANMTCPLCFGTFVEKSDTVERPAEAPVPTLALDPAEVVMQKQLYDVLKSKYYCYECKSKVQYMDATIWEIVNLRCPNCNSTFMEEITTAHPWFDKDEAETIERNEGYVDQTLALLTAQPVASGEGNGFAWVPPERNMQAFLSKEDKFKMWEVTNKYNPLEDADGVNDEFPDLPPPSLPAYGTVNPKTRKPRSFSCGTTRDSTDEDDDEDDNDTAAWEKVGNERHPNRVSRLDKRRLKKELRKTTLQLRRAQEIQERADREKERKLRAEEDQNQRVRAREKREEEVKIKNAKAGEMKKNLNLVASMRSK